LTGSARGPEAPSTEIRSPGFYFLHPLKHRQAATAIGVAFDSHPPFDVQAVRRDFPILAERVNGMPLIWCDSAATSRPFCREAQPSSYRRFADLA
jgi:cysteine desulfurase/selenocysteine lyase